MMRKLTATILATSMALGNCANIYAEDTNKNNTNTNIVSKSNTVNNEKNESTTIITTMAQVKIEKATEVTTEATTEEKKKVEVITEKAVQTTTEAVTEATTKVTTEAVTETTTEAAKEETTQAATEAVKEETTEATTEAVKEETTEATTEAVKEETTEIVTEGNKEASSEATTASSELKKLADAPTEATTAEPATATETTTKKYYYSSSSSDSGLFEINKEETLYLDLNETVDLSKYVSNLISIEDYEWNTGNKKIVEVSSDGVIKGVSSGKTTVSAYYYSGEYYFQYIFTVNVDNEDVTAEKEFTIYVDATKDLGQFISKVAEPFEYDWSCDNKSIATVSNKGVVTGKKQGTTKINAKYHNGRYDYNYVFKITVKDTSGVSANTATISEKNVWSLYMPVGDGIYLEDFLTRNYNDYKWKISDEDVVEFKNGKLSGLKEGKTTVTATYGSKVITFNLMINNKYEIVEADIKVKTSLDIRGCLDEDVSKYEITSDREPVVTVGENAVLTGHNAGMATVLAKGSKGKIIQVVCTVANTGATKLGSKITANGRVDVRTYTNAYKENPTTSAVKEENEQEEANSASNAVFDDIAHRTWAVASIE
ncbi:MAG: Ig-like domain-containing protein, partial [Firmicutes bacterium]|nr:Ig-like domain-containing protein [Bacillota bacterium]